MTEQSLKDFIKDFEILLKDVLPDSNTVFNSVNKAMEYSLLSGGKRLRPFIMKLFYNACGGCDNHYINFAAAIEMIHTYSLIHDDLPCMDNDDYRRGRPSCHKAFSESCALLAGDGLLTFAFETASKTQNIPPERILLALNTLAESAGVSGMIYGQVIDLECEHSKADINIICEMYKNKTGALLAAASKIGCILGNADKKQIDLASSFAYNLGIAFQIQDDILDILGDSATLGKPVGSDEKNQKSTYVSLLGLEKAKADVLKYTTAAKCALENFNGSSEPLFELADFLINRSF